jgi:hypothetical protein
MKGRADDLRNGQPLLMTPYRRRPGASAYDWIVSRNRYSYETEGVRIDAVAA